MMRSISSMSATIPARSASSRVLISTPRRSRASGVRRSCETPASSSARSCSMLAQIGGHRVEAAIDRGDLGGTGLGQRRRRFAAADARDRGRQLAQRPREVAREHERGDEQERERPRASTSSARVGIVVGRRPRRQPERRSSKACPAATTRTNSSRSRGAKRISVSGPSARAARSASSASRRTVGACPRIGRSSSRERCARRIRGSAPAQRLAALGVLGRRERGADRLQLHDLGLRHCRLSRLARSARNSTMLVSTASATTATSRSSTQAPEQRARQQRHAPSPWRRGFRGLVPASPERRRSRSPTPSGCSAGSPDRARPACAGARPARRSRGRTLRGRGRARAS